MKITIRISLIILVFSLGACSIFSKKKRVWPYADFTAPVMPAWLTGDTTQLISADFLPGKEVGFLLPDRHRSMGVSEIDRFKLVPDETLPGLKLIKPKIDNLGVLFGLSLLNFTDKSRCDLILKKPVQIPIAFSYTGNCKKGVFVKGDFNAWNAKSHPLQKVSDSVYTTTISLDPGEYAYQFLVDDAELVDAANPVRRSNGFGGENSVLAVKETRPVPHITAAVVTDGFSVEQTENMGTSGLNIIALWNNRIIYQSLKSENKRNLLIPKEAESLRRSYIRVFCATEFVHGNDLLIPLEYGKPVTDPNLLSREDLERTVMYFAFVDRFKNGEQANDKPVDHPLVTTRTNFQGGDIQGITQKVKEGYLDSLGMNALWISPISKNPKGAWGNFPDPQVKFSGYHGYWPVSNTLIDDRFGNAMALKEMLDEAHKHKNNVYLDYVAHHVHKEHPIYKQHPDWVTPLYLPDGRMNTELWDEQRLTTWFDTFLPTLDLGRPEVASYMVDSALFWLKEFEFDGFRHDATKHIPENFTRLLTAKIRTEIEPKRKQRIYQIGETYGNTKLIGSYLGHGLLDAQFDFNLYDAMMRTFAWGGPFTGLVTEQLRSLGQYGSHHLMGNITGNQDKPRFMSSADGTITGKTNWNEGKKMGHLGDLPLKTDSAYQKFLQFYTWLFFSPGIPVVYYGDEIGMTGGNDPGNRNMMQFSGLGAAQTEFKNKISELAKLRTGSMALCYGDYKVITSNDSQVVVVRRYLNELAVMAINRGSEAIIFDAAQPGALYPVITEFGGVPKGTWSVGFDKDNLIRLRKGFFVQPGQSVINIYSKN
ncbi:MAG: alpha-amylase family glycosyl hydrolase [Sphingomonadales bacterium]